MKNDNEVESGGYNYLVRHGETNANLNDYVQGWFDVPLNETGRAQCIAAAKEIKKLGIKRIIASDLIRTRQTAEIINQEAGLNLDITFDQRLREYYHGVLEGKKIGELPNGKDTVNDCYISPHKYEAEAALSFYGRAKKFIADLKKMTNTLVVAHGGVLDMFLYCDKNDSWQPEKWIENDIHNCKILKYPPR